MSLSNAKDLGCMGIILLFVATPSHLLCSFFYVELIPRTACFKRNDKSQSNLTEEVPNAGVLLPLWIPADSVRQANRRRQEPALLLVASLAISFTGPFLSPVTVTN